MAADGVASVYRVPVGHNAFGTLYDYDGCTVGSHTSQRLATRALSGVRVFSCVASECRLVRLIRLRAATVGVIVERHAVDTITSTLTIRDLAHQHVLHRVQAHLVIGYGDALITYVLARSGNIAWATETTSPNSHAHATIRRAIGHTASMLDDGPKVRASSLRLRGKTIEWIDAGTKRTAALP